MRYRRFGDRLTTLSALTVRLEDARRKGSANDWRDFVFAALEAGINTFEIGQTSANMLTGVAEAFAAVERRLYVVSWRTGMGDEAASPLSAARSLIAALGIDMLDILILDMDRPLHNAMLIDDLREAGAARWICAAGPAGVLDDAISRRCFDGIALKLDPEGGWNERNRIRAASASGMGVIALEVTLEFGKSEDEPRRRGLLSLFARREPPAAAFRIDVPGWSEQEVAIAHALTEPSISTVVVQPTCTPGLEALAWCVERDLPAGAQAQIEMARFSNGAEVVVERRRTARRA